MNRRKRRLSGVPVILGENGVEKVIEARTPDEEQAGFQKSLEAVNEK